MGTSRFDASTQGVEKEGAAPHAAEMTASNVHIS